MPAAPTATKTPSPTDTLPASTESPTATDDHAATVTPTTPPVVCENQIANGDFEGGSTGWLEMVSGQERPGALIRTDLGRFRPYSGAWGAWLGGYNNAAEGLASRSVLQHRPPNSGQPGDLVSAELSWVWAMVSSEVPVGAVDGLGVYLLALDSNEEQSLGLITNCSPRDTWIQSSRDMTPFLLLRPAWQRSVLSFAAVTDASLPTSWFLNEVELRVCYLS